MKAPETLIESLLAQADRALSGDYSAMLYGSLARGDFLPGRSDLNVLLVVRPLTRERLRALAPALVAFERDGHTPPLLFDDEEWRRVADVFPIEITDMRFAYRLLRGPDPLRDRRVEPADLRRALEHEWRGKVLRLRQDFAAHLDRPDRLGQAMAGSAGSVRVLLRATLGLAGRTPPADDAGLVAAAGQVTGAAEGPLTQALAHRRDPAWRCDADRFEPYLTAVERITHFVDHYHPGDA
jgi:predicted nucleotidyltransferase